MASVAFKVTESDRLSTCFELVSCDQLRTVSNSSIENSISAQKATWCSARVNSEKNTMVISLNEIYKTCRPRALDVRWSLQPLPSVPGVPDEPVKFTV